MATDDEKAFRMMHTAQELLNRAIPSDCLICGEETRFKLTMAVPSLFGSNYKGQSLHKVERTIDICEGCIPGMRLAWSQALEAWQIGEGSTWRR